jgi:hypothetical protein
MSSVRLATLMIILAAALGACASGAAPAPSSPSKAAPSLSATPTSSASSEGGVQIDTPDEAARLVIASDPNFEKVGKKDPDLIGQCCYYEAVRGQEGFRVRITMGWGDCPAGCIDQHTWTYEVGADGAIRLIGQSGDAVPPGGIPGG